MVHWTCASAAASCACSCFVSSSNRTWPAFDGLAGLERRSSTRCRANPRSRSRPVPPATVPIPEIVVGHDSFFTTTVVTASGGIWNAACCAIPFLICPYFTAPIAAMNTNKAPTVTTIRFFMGTKPPRSTPESRPRKRPLGTGYGFSSAPGERRVESGARSSPEPAGYGASTVFGVPSFPPHGSGIVRSIQSLYAYATSGDSMFRQGNRKWLHVARPKGFLGFPQSGIGPSRDTPDGPRKERHELDSCPRDHAVPAARRSGTHLLPGRRSEDVRLVRWNAAGPGFDSSRHHGRASSSSWAAC